MMDSSPCPQARKRPSLRKAVLPLALSLVLALPYVGFAGEVVRLRDRFKPDENQLVDTDIGDLMNLGDYGDVLESYRQAGYRSPDVSPVVLAPSMAKGPEGAAPTVVSDYEGRQGEALLWHDGTSLYEWTFAVSESGLYEVETEYCPVPGDVTPIRRRLFLDGEVPYRQADNLFLPRRWEEATDPYFDLDNNEKSPRLRQVTEWSVTSLSDSKGLYPNPLRLYLAAGTHTLGLEYVSAPVALGEIRVRPAASPPSYADALAAWTRDGFVPYQGEAAVQEAESAEWRSHQTLKRVYSADPATSPSPRGNVLQNTIGGGRWQNGGQSITWVMDVPEDGLYRLSFRILQNYGAGVTVHRQVLVDGVVPFREVEAYPFLYENRWRTQAIADPQGQPYLFALKKGKRAITLQVMTGTLTPLVRELEACNLLLSDIIRDITAVTSSQPDPNFQYDLDKVIPWIMEDFDELARRLGAQAEYLEGVSARRPPLANSLLSAVQEIEGLLKFPNTIPNKLNDLVNMQTNLANWYLSMQYQPLTVDQVWLTARDEAAPDLRSGFFRKLTVVFLNVFQSFFKDYDSIGTGAIEGIEVPTDEYRKIDVWVARPKEWGELLQVLADEEFTTRTGIFADINILPAGSAGAIGISPLMLSIISGKAPDVAVSSDIQTPVELAIRESAQDLSGYPDFEAIRDRFLPGTMTPFEYEGGVYALPETMNFMLMFYRKDIVGEMGIPLPDTWDDLYSRTIPRLKQNGAEMFMYLDFNMFLFQKGGSLYREGNRRTGLDSEEAYNAFLQWTDNYTVYKVTASANLFNHFRVGDIPIAIGTMSEYLMFLHAAPELFGRWDIAPIPGTKREDGTIDRTSGGGVTSSMIFSQSDDKEAAWEFLAWWMSDETQLRYGTEIESIIGPEARWLSANVAAYRNMAWEPRHLAVMNEAFKWIRNPPNVLGGYYTGRHLNNAWTRTVLGGMNARDSLEAAVKEINRELERKNQEYERIYGDGKHG